MSGRAIDHEVGTKTCDSANCFVDKAIAFVGTDPTVVRCFLALADGRKLGTSLTASQARDLANKLNACATVAERAPLPKASGGGS